MNNIIICISPSFMQHKLNFHIEIFAFFVIIQITWDFIPSFYINRATPTQFSNTSYVKRTIYPNTRSYYSSSSREWIEASNSNVLCIGYQEKQNRNPKNSHCHLSPASHVYKVFPLRILELQRRDNIEMRTTK